MIERWFSADRLNAVVNDPSIYPWVCGEHVGHLDLRPVIDDRRNVLLMGEHGGVLFVLLQPGIYEAHTQVLPAGRGRWCLDMVNEALAWMFCRTDAVEIMTRCPQGNVAAKALARAIGGCYEFTNPNGWVFNRKPIPADIFALRIQDWMRTAEFLPAIGHDFHERLDEQYRALGVVSGVHPDDAIHDRYVGAAAAMIMGGQPHKAVIFYNRWAALAGYAPIALLREAPIRVDIRDAVLEVNGGTFEVTECRLVQ